MNRKEYMDTLPRFPSPESHAHHRAYFAQFVTPGCKEAVLNSIGLDRLTASTDPHLNDIPLSEWDRIGGGSGLAHKGDSKLHRVPHWVPVVKLREAGEALPLSVTVCIVKEAARQLVEDHAPKD